jgi:hypothetical protein
MIHSLPSQKKWVSSIKRQIMILIYSQNPINKDEIDNTINQLKDKLSLFFVDDDDFIFSTETNHKLLRELIINHNVNLFHIHSIKQIGFSPTEICELIIFLLKNGIYFQSELDNLYLSEDNIDTVYPTIFEIFRDKSL